jgi:hypothetical protein
MARTIREDPMDFDRKTMRDISKLTQEAQRLWEEQREILNHAKDMALDASRHAGDVARRGFLPRARALYTGVIQPNLSRLPWQTIAAVPKKSSNPLVYVLMAVGAIAVAVLSYSAWQTLRADDDLWVEEDAE